MRRVGVIVALGALLGMLGGMATASPALAAGRADGWQFVSLPPTFTVPADFCGFDIQGTQLVDKVFAKALKPADGSMILLFTGAAKISLTNPANAKTITANTSGPQRRSAFLTAPSPCWRRDFRQSPLSQPTRRASGCLPCSCLRAR